MTSKQNFDQKLNGNGHHAQSSANLPPKTEQLWTRRQVADTLQVCIHTVARYEKAGLLTSLKFNKRVVRYNPQEVREFIRRGEAGEARHNL